MTVAAIARGQALTEYLVVASALALALLVPIDGDPLAQTLVDALARTCRNFAFLVATS